MGCCFSKELNPNLVSERTSLLQAAIPEGSTAKDVKDCAWSVADLTDVKPSQNGNVNAALDTSCNASSTNLSAALNLIKEGGSSIQEGMAFWDPPVGDPHIHEATVQKGNASELGRDRRDNCQIKETETLDFVKQRIAENAIMRAKWFCGGQQSCSTDLTGVGKSKNEIQNTLGISPLCISKDQHSDVSIIAKEEQVKTLWHVQSKPASTPKHAISPFNKCSGNSMNLDDSEEGNSGLLITDRGFKKEQSFYSICLIDLEDLGSECGHQSMTESDAVRYASAPAVSEKALFDNSSLPKDHTISGSGPSHEITAAQQTEKGPTERTLVCSEGLRENVALPNEEHTLPDLLNPFPAQENEKLLSENDISTLCKDTENTHSPFTAVEDGIDQLSPDLLLRNVQMPVLKSSTDTASPQGEPADLLNNHELYGSSGYKATDLETGSELNMHNTVFDESMLRPLQQKLNGPLDEVELENHDDYRASMDLKEEEKKPIVSDKVDYSISSLSNTADRFPNFEVAIEESDQCASKKTPTEKVYKETPQALSAFSTASEKLDDTEDHGFPCKDTSEDMENLKLCFETPLASDKEDNLSKSPSCHGVEVEPRQIATREEVVLNPCQCNILQCEGQTNESDMFKVAQCLSSPSHAENTCVDSTCNAKEDKLDMTLSTHVYTYGVFPTDQSKIVSESCDIPNGEQNVEPNANFTNAVPCDMSPCQLPTNAPINFEQFLEVTHKCEEADYHNVHSSSSSVVEVHTNTPPVPDSVCPLEEDLSQGDATWFVKASNNDICNKGHPESVAVSYLIQVGLGNELPEVAQEQVVNSEIGETCLQHDKKTHIASECFSEDEQKVLGEICLLTDDDKTKMSELEQQGLVPTLELLNCSNNGNNNNDCLKSVCSASSDVYTPSDPPCKSEVLETFDCTSLSINCTSESAFQYLDSSSEQPSNDTQRSSVSSIQVHGDLQDMGEIGGDVVDCSIPLVTSRLSLETGEAQSCAIQGHGANYASVESSTTTMPHVSQLITSSLGVLDFDQSDLKVIVEDMNDKATYVNAAIPLPVEPDQVDIYATMPSYEIHFLNKDLFTVPVQVENLQASGCTDEMEGEQGMLNMVSDLLGKSELSDEVDSSHCLPAWAKEPHVLFSDNQIEACALVSAWDHAVSEASLAMQNVDQDTESNLVVGPEDFQTSMDFIAPYPYNLLATEGSCVWDWQNAFCELVSTL